MTTPECFEQVDDVYDVAVLGAGAAGLVAAIRASECGVRVILLEKNRRPGVKILMSGGTRCNITNRGGFGDLSQSPARSIPSSIQLSGAVFVRSRTPSVQEAPFSAPRFGSSTSTRLCRACSRLKAWP